MYAKLLEYNFKKMREHLRKVGFRHNLQRFLFSLNLKEE